MNDPITPAQAVAEIVRANMKLPENYERPASGVVRFCISLAHLNILLQDIEQRAAPTAPQPPAGEAELEKQLHAVWNDGWNKISSILRAAFVSSELAQPPAGEAREISAPEFHSHTPGCRAIRHARRMIIADQCNCDARFRLRDVPFHDDDTGRADRARAYMAEAMAMPNSDSDQEQNWIFGHLITFALREIDYAERAASVSGEAEPQPCSECGCEERDHRGILTCRCPEQPTYRALKADAGHWKHEAEMAREEIKALKAEIEGACALLTKANSGTAETIQLARRLGDGDAMDWISAAKRLGEMLAADGPNGYYQFTPKEWFDWASAQLRLKA